MDVVWPPCVRVISPGIRARFDGVKFIIALGIGQTATCAEKIGVERRGVLVYFVDVPPGGVGLPNFEERVFERAAKFVGNFSVDDNSFAERLAIFSGVFGQIVVVFAKIETVKNRRRALGQRFFQKHERLGGRAQNR